MFNVGPAELMIILIVALLVLGPKRLPDAARQVGKAVSEFRRVSAGLQEEVKSFTDEFVEATPPPAAVTPDTAAPTYPPGPAPLDPGPADAPPSQPSG